MLPHSVNASARSFTTPFYFSFPTEHGEQNRWLRQVTAADSSPLVNERPRYLSFMQGLWETRIPASSWNGFFWFVPDVYDEYLLVDFFLCINSMNICHLRSNIMYKTIEIWNTDTTSVHRMTGDRGCSDTSATESSATILRRWNRAKKFTHQVHLHVCMKQNYDVQLQMYLSWIQSFLCCLLWEGGGGETNRKTKTAQDFPASSL